jgi:hypothetical protein
VQFPKAGNGQIENGGKALRAQAARLRGLNEAGERRGPPRGQNRAADVSNALIGGSRGRIVRKRGGGVEAA